MRQAYVHTAAVRLADGADPAALGGAITLALCGSWQHEGPCPLAAHHTTTGAGTDADGTTTVRVLIASDARDEAAVRMRIDGALAAGRVIDPNGVEQRWSLLRSGAGRIGEAELAHARRLLSQ